MGSMCGCEDGKCVESCEPDRCVRKQKDWAGFYYCPDVCKAGIDCPAGSCGDNKAEYESCECSGQCSGDMTCCDGQCRVLQIIDQMENHVDVMSNVQEI